MVGQLGQRLGGTHADAARQAQPLQQPGAHGKAAPGQITRHSMKADERLVNGIDFLLRSQSGCNLHHACRHVAVQNKIGAQRLDAGMWEVLDYLKIRVSHLDAQRLGFIRPGDRAPIVVRQHDHRPALEPWLEHLLAAHIEVVAIHQREHENLTSAAPVETASAHPAARPGSPGSGQAWARYPDSLDWQPPASPRRQRCAGT